MNDLLEYIRTWSALKWIVLVLIAGFIGQFGKMAAQAITAKIRARHKDEPVKPQPIKTSPNTTFADKKYLKALAKAKKKESKKKY